MARGFQRLWHPQVWGSLLGWFWAQTAASATAVLAGLVMLAVLAEDAVRRRAAGLPDAPLPAAERPDDQDPSDRQ